MRQQERGISIGEFQKIIADAYFERDSKRGRSGYIHVVC
jgi:hypothetical protein